MWTDSPESRSSEREVSQDAQPMPMPVDAQMALLAQALGGCSALEIHNFEGTPKDQYHLSSMAVSGEGKGLGDSVGEEIEVKYAYLHGVQVKGKTSGEMVDAIRVVLISPSNQIYHCVSGIVASDVHRAWNSYGRKPFNPPLKFKVVKRKTASKNDILTIIPLD